MSTNLAARIWNFYADGFRSMTIGRKLWVIILVKLAVIFLVLKLFFFPNILQERYSSDAERAEAVREALTPAQNHEITNQITNTLHHD